MRGWLGEYLDSIGKDQQVFLDAYDKLGTTNLKYIKTEYVEWDSPAPKGVKLLEKIDVKPQKRMFQHIAQALNGLDSIPDSSSTEVRVIQNFHKQWQERMRSDTQTHAEYHEMVVERLVQLDDDGFALNQLVGGDVTSNSVEAYSLRLGELLLSPETNGAKLIAEIEKLLRFAEQKHIERIVELTTVLAYHFVPKSLWKSRNDNGMTVVSEEPAPAIYRLIQNWRSGVVSQSFDYEGKKGGVQGAIPLNRKVLDTDDFVSSIAELVDMRIDDRYLAKAGQDGYEVTGLVFSPQRIQGIDYQLFLESETSSGPFVYGLQPGVLDSESSTKLEESLPSLKHYSHTTEKAEEFANVIKLDGFLKIAGSKIDERIKSFEVEDPLFKLSQLISTELKQHGQSEKLAQAPKTSQPIKYLEYFNELLKTEKYLAGVFTRHPELVEKVSGMVSGAMNFSTTHFSEIVTLLKNIGKGVGQ